MDDLEQEIGLIDLYQEVSSRNFNRDDDRKLIFNAICEEATDEAEKSFAPYINYVLDHLQRQREAWKANSSRSIHFFVLLVKFFSSHPTASMARFLDDRSTEIGQILGTEYNPPSNLERQRDVISAAMTCFSLWTMIESLEDRWPRASDSATFSIKSLIESQNLFPKAETQAGPSTEISHNELNASVLADVCGASLQWSHDLASHLVLENGQLQIFAMPCKMRSGTTKDNDPQKALLLMGIPESYYMEIRRSYGLLFRPRKARRHINRIDPTQIRSPSATVDLAGLEPFARMEYYNAWRRKDFEHLWPRIVRMHEFAVAKKPESFWEALRDRRNTVTYWGFMVAFLALALTLIQTITSIVQTVKAFV